MEPLSITVLLLNLNTITGHVPEHVGVGDQPTSLSAAMAAEPGSILDTASWDPSKFSVKLTPETWAPPWDDRVTGTMTVSPGLPESLPIEITASAGCAAALLVKTNSRKLGASNAENRFIMTLV